MQNKYGYFVFQTFNVSYSSLLCNSFGGFTFALKTQFKINPILVIVCCLTMVLLMLGVAVTVVERLPQIFCHLNLFNFKKNLSICHRIKLEHI